MKLGKVMYWYWGAGALQACDYRRTLKAAKKAALECRLGGAKHSHTFYQVRSVR